jgi:hypothetical protein
MAQPRRSAEHYSRKKVLPSAGAGCQREPSGAFSALAPANGNSQYYFPREAIAHVRMMKYFYHHYEPHAKYSQEFGSFEILRRLPDSSRAPLSGPWLLL